MRRLARRAGKLWLSWRYRDFDPASRPERRVRVAGLHLRVLPDVFDPALHFTSGALAERLKRPGIVPPGSSVLDVGTGSGILAVAAVLAGASRVVAIDVNLAAVECARLNARRYGVLGQVNVRHGDMFAPVAGERFDLVLVNPPYFRGEARTLAQRAYMAGAEFEWIKRFAKEVPNVLEPHGVAIMTMGDAGELPAIVALLRAEGIAVRSAGCREYLAETVHFFELRPQALRSAK
jgi:release factor glutamine methyltransferase